MRFPLPVICMDAAVDSIPPTVDEARSLYAGLPELYPAEDTWHRVTHQWIASQVRKVVPFESVRRDSPLLNLGSAGVSFGFPESATLHVDIHSAGFSHDQRLVIADIQRLPPLGMTFATCLCVGSVLNHCTAAEVIANIHSVLRPGGMLLLEFESSRSFALLPTHI